MHLLRRVLHSDRGSVVLKDAGRSRHLDDIIRPGIGECDENPVSGPSVPHQAGREPDRQTVPVRPGRHVSENIPVLLCLAVIPVKVHHKIAVQRAEGGDAHRDAAACQRLRDHISLSRHDLLTMDLGGGRVQKEIDRQIQLAIKEEKETVRQPDQPQVDVKLSGSFESNKGKLPMPITGAYLVVGEYGVQNVAGLKDVKQNNLGIDIQGQDGAQARAVFDGTVSSIFQQGKGQIGVLIRHGSYISVYCNLSETRLKKGDTVKTSDIVGDIQTSEDGTPVLHFQLHKESTRLNPSDWLRR